MTGWTIVDAVLAVALAALAWRVVTGRDTFEACVGFIAYGLLLALAWARLDAIDVALAEAGVGAGVTGALVLDALARVGEPAPPPRVSRLRAATRLLACGAVGAGVLLVLGTLPAPTGEARALVDARLADSGVSNPVTAVLLNFRALDTLLEVGVMWTAVVAAWAVLPARSPPPPTADAGPALAPAVRLLVPVVVLLAVYLWWAGSSRPGGAFQAAALVGGAGVWLALVGRLGGALHDRPAARLALVAGFACFLAVAVATSLAGGRHLLEYPRELAYPLIVVIEAVCVVAIGAGFTALFAARRGPAPAGGAG